MEKNFLNFKIDDIDRPIFRFLTIERLFEIFKTHSNVLVSPKLWDDPFENHIMTSFFNKKQRMKKIFVLALETIFMDNAGHKLEKVTQCGEYIPLKIMELE